MAYIPRRRSCLGVAGALAALAAGWTAVTPAKAQDAAVALPPAKAGETLADVLLPGGKQVGQTSKQMRELAGGEQAANALFNRLTAGAADVTPPITCWTDAGAPGLSDR